MNFVGHQSGESRRVSPCATAQTLTVVSDAEIFGESGLYVRGFFRDMLDHGAARPSFEHSPQARKTFCRTDRVNFNAAVAQIAHVAAQFQAFRFILREIAEADALYDPEDKIAACNQIGTHEM